MIYCEAWAKILLPLLIRDNPSLVLKLELALVHGA